MGRTEHQNLRPFQKREGSGTLKGKTSYSALTYCSGIIQRWALGNRKNAEGFATRHASQDTSIGGPFGSFGLESSDDFGLFGTSFYTTMNAATAPLNKLSDCAGNAAVSNFVPFGDKLVGSGPKTPLDKAKSASDAVHDLGKVATHSATIARALDQIALPNIGELVAKYGPKVAAAAEYAEPAGYLVSGTRAAVQIGACYNAKGN